MRAYAVIEFGLDYTQSGKITLSFFSELYEAHIQKEKRLLAHKSALARMQTYWLLNVHLNKDVRLKVTDLWSVDGDEIEEIKLPSVEDQRKMVELLGGAKFTVGE